MKTNFWACCALLLASGVALGQGPQHVTTGGAKGGPDVMYFAHRPMGAWWKNSEVVSKLNLTDPQVQQLEGAFYQHKMRFIDLRANIEKQDLKLQELLDAANPDDSAILAQVDQRSQARNQLDREFTQMTLEFRKILTPDQWKQLRALMPEDGPGTRIMMHHFNRGPAGKGMGTGPGAPAPDDAPPPPPGSLP